MKTKIALVVLIAVCVGLGVGLISVKQKSEEQHNSDMATNRELARQWTVTRTNLDDQKQYSLSLEKDLTARKADIAKFSNDLAQSSESLAKTEAALKASREETAQREAKIAEQTAKINELEGKNLALDKQAEDMKGSINDLESKISDTQKKLATAEGDKAFLTSELHRLMAEKDALEKKFMDLNILRDQVRKLKEELSVARRMEWIREKVFANQDEKGASKLMHTIQSPKSPTNHYDLNVEINSDGTTKTIPPITNAPVLPKK